MLAFFCFLIGNNPPVLFLNTIMATTLSTARATLLDLKILLAKQTSARAELVSASQSTTAIDANIASIHAAITTQRASVRTLSGFFNASRINSIVPVNATTSFDSVPTNGSGNAVQSGGVYSVLQTKQDAFTSATDFTFDDVSSTKLTTSAIDCGANVTGTIRTTLQPNVQAVGQLSGLNVNAPSTISLNSIALAVRTDGKMGVATPFSNVGAALDVGGNVNITGTYRGSGRNTHGQGF
jgi:hypothetical protein